MSALDDLLELTRNMFTAAHAGDFDRVSALDQARLALLDGGIEAQSDAASVVEAILACDRELVAAVASERSHVAEQLRQARIAQAGVGSYLGVAFTR
jgi:hypothetical protein